MREASCCRVEVVKGGAGVRRAGFFSTEWIFRLAPSTAAWAARAGGHGPHWDYRGAHDPAHWAELDPAFEACAKGGEQSPVNIDKTLKVALPALEFSYGTAQASVVNNGHTIQVNLPAGQVLKVDGRSFELLQFHFDKVFNSVVTSL